VALPLLEAQLGSYTDDFGRLLVNSASASPDVMLHGSGLQVLAGHLTRLVSDLAEAAIATTQLPHSYQLCAPGLTDRWLGLPFPQHHYAHARIDSALFVECLQMQHTPVADRVQTTTAYFHTAFNAH